MTQKLLLRGRGEFTWQGGDRVGQLQRRPDERIRFVDRIDDAQGEGPHSPPPRESLAVRL